MLRGDGSSRRAQGGLYYAKLLQYLGNSGSFRRKYYFKLHNVFYLYFQERAS
jgi:hypothetical protein